MLVVPVLSKKIMAASSNPDLSTLATTSAAPLEELPAVTVSRNAFDVIIQWDSGGTAATPFTLYSDAPYSLSAVQANQKEPFLKTFGSLLRCNGGILIIGQKRYRIQVQQQEQQYPGKRQLEEMVDDRIAAKLRVQRAKRPTRTLSYISKSTALDNTTILRRVWFHQSFFFDLISLPHGFHTEAFKTPGPLETSDDAKCIIHAS